MKEISKESHAYAIENLLVLVMVSSAIALQVRRRRFGKDKGPLLLRLLDAVPEEVKPLPLVLVDQLIPKK